MDSPDCVVCQIVPDQNLVAILFDVLVMPHYKEAYCANTSELEIVIIYLIVMKLNAMDLSSFKSLMYITFLAYPLLPCNDIVIETFWHNSGTVNCANRG